MFICDLWRESSGTCAGTRPEHVSTIYRIILFRRGAIVGSSASRYYLPVDLIWYRNNPLTSEDGHIGERSAQSVQNRGGRISYPATVKCAGYLNPSVRIFVKMPNGQFRAVPLTKKRRERFSRNTDAVIIDKKRGLLG